MSYDLTFFKISGQMPNEEGFCEDDIQIIGSPEQLKGELSSILPDLNWELALADHADYAFWQSVITDEDTWYRFHISATEPTVNYFTVRTSHRTLSRKLIPLICSRLDLVAFDMQTEDVIEVTIK
ncbi:hypothetical protein [Pseudanabaena sp. UWO310]|uniref:hypothetical protein n=1 Tax=Pseudanabaena sp. UWO310 TaxID=2480795 RepID=UPI00115B3C89|nr:hypothetical protein [Pseudanabaena sp. UWO310]TYQ29253.1 hypothetical protein PseudUWO310_13245 [Pseudanabaena sp. UWO310]